MFSDLVSIDVLLRLSSVVETLLTFSNIAGVVALISLFKAFPMVGNNIYGKWLLICVFAVCLSAGLAQSAKRMAFGDLSKDEVVVDKSFLLKNGT